MKTVLIITGVILLGAVVWVIYQYNSPKVVSNNGGVMPRPLPPVFATGGLTADNIKQGAAIYGCRNGVRFLYTPNGPTLWTKTNQPCQKGDKQL